jgi:hypothetical protein
VYFFIKTANPRPTFHTDMTTEERTIMERHVAFWSEKASQGKAIVFGPVMDPAGVYGIAVSQVRDEAECERFSRAIPQRASCIMMWFCRWDAPSWARFTVDRRGVSPAARLGDLVGRGQAVAAFRNSTQANIVRLDSSARIQWAIGLLE